MKVISIVGVIFVFCSAVSAQQLQPSTVSKTRIVDWTRIESKAKDFSFLVPAEGFLTRKTDRSSSVFYFKDDLGLRASFSSGFNGKDWIKEYAMDKDFRDDCDALNIEGYLVLQCGLKPDKETKKERDDFFLAIGNGKNYYTVRILKSEQTPTFLLDSLASIQFKGIALFKGTGNSPVAINTVNEANLVQDDVVTKALAQPDSTQAKLEKAKSDVTSSIDVASIKYSRPLIIIESPGPKMRQFALDNRFYGQVNLSVTFLANGQIGPIKLLSVSGSGAGITNDAFDSAKRIKFIPAEVDGKPVDVVDYYGTYLKVFYAF